MRVSGRARTRGTCRREQQGRAIAPARSAGEGPGGGGKVLSVRGGRPPRRAGRARPATARPRQPREARHSHPLCPDHPSVGAMAPMGVTVDHPAPLRPFPVPLRTLPPRRPPSRRPTRVALPPLRGQLGHPAHRAEPRDPTRRGRHGNGHGSARPHPAGAPPEWSRHRPAVGVKHLL